MTTLFVVGPRKTAYGNTSTSHSL